MFDGQHLPHPLRATWTGKARFTFVARSIRVDGSVAGSTVLLNARTHAHETSITARQREIAVLYAQGRSHKEVAANLDLSPATVRNHLTAIYSALQVHSRRELSRVLEPHGDRARARGMKHLIG